jgi:predicted dehydrogenase
MRLFFLLALMAAALPAQEKLRLGVVGLTHGHAAGFFRNYLARTDVDIVGISEPDSELAARYADRYKLDRSRLFSTHAAMLDQAKPEAVMVFTSTFAHKEVVELCARRKVHVMMEKPLAVSVEHGNAMAAAAKTGGIHVMVNYETTWYPVNAPIWRMAREDNKLGKIRRIVTHYGHQGPKEIGVGPEFLGWLTNPVQNGAGALYDFGCYGANFATWLLGAEKPLSVFAVTYTNKPAIYAHVDDEATVVVQYPGTQLIIQPSWNWPYGRKDMEVYGETGYITTANPRDYRFRYGGMPKEQAETAGPLTAPDDDVIRYLTAVVRGRRQPDGLSSLANNLMVTEILAAARDSARTGKAVQLGR